jgi:DNA-binding NarL/FixJ family response regulator
MVRILVADDHEVVRVAVRQILEAQRNWCVVAEAGDGKEAVTKASETKPDVCVVDYALPVLSGLEVTRQIRAHVPDAEVLIFTMHESEKLASDLVRAGARGYLLKSEAQCHLVEAVASVARHQPYFTKTLSAALVETHLVKPEKAASALTGRERTIVRLIAEGYPSKEMARVLNISPKTVETHRATIMRKLGVGSSADVVRYAVRNNIIEA